MNPYVSEKFNNHFFKKIKSNQRKAKKKNWRRNPPLFEINSCIFFPLSTNGVTYGSRSKALTIAITISTFPHFKCSFPHLFFHDPTFRAVRVPTLTPSYENPQISTIKNMRKIKKTVGKRTQCRIVNESFKNKSS